MKQTARLEKWRVAHGNRLNGKVYGHPRFKDGDWIVTSEVLSVIVHDETVETKNTIYQLGERYSELGISQLELAKFELA